MTAEGRRIAHANNGASGVAVHEASVVRMLTLKPSVLLRSRSLARADNRVQRCNTNRFISSLALIELGRSASTICRVKPL